MAFYIKKTKKDFIMTEEKEDDYRNIIICRFCEKGRLSDKVRDHCHLTDKNRGPAHSIFKINVAQDRRSFIPFVIQKVRN